MCIHVSCTNPDHFHTIQAGIDYAGTLPPHQRIIAVHRGIYHERVKIQIPHIRIIGEDPRNTIITNSCSALELDSAGNKLGTFRTQTVMIEADDIRINQLTIENSAGPGWLKAQAIALYADGDRIALENCRLIACQDTLFTGPRLRKLETDGLPQIPQRHFYRNCFIQGDVDFIFGCAAAYFEKCEFYSTYTPRPKDQPDRSQTKEDQNDAILGYVTAAATPKGQEFGFVMDRCSFTGNCPPKSVFLGRPWRDHTKTVLLNCNLGEHIHPAGWHDWNKIQAHNSTFYAEFSSTGPGAANKFRAPWTHTLTQKEADQFQKKRVLMGWNPDHPLFSHIPEG